MEVAIHVDPRVFNSVYVPYLTCTDRYLIFYGGGSSGKSFFIAQRYILKMVTPTRCNLLCVRQTADTNRKSTFPLLKQVISLWQLGDFFKVNESDMRIQCTLTGNEIAFAGLDDVEKIKSITFAGGELTDIWVEEATECQEADVNQLKVRQPGEHPPLDQTAFYGFGAGQGVLQHLPGQQIFKRRGPEGAGGSAPQRRIHLPGLLPGAVGHSGQDGF